MKAKNIGFLEISETASDNGFDISAVVSSLLLYSKIYNGLVHGPALLNTNSLLPVRKNSEGLYLK